MLILTIVCIMCAVVTTATLLAMIRYEMAVDRQIAPLSEDINSYRYEQEMAVTRIAEELVEIRTALDLPRFRPAPGTPTTFDQVFEAMDNAIDALRSS